MHEKYGSPAAKEIDLVFFPYMYVHMEMTVQTQKFIYDFLFLSLLVMFVYCYAPMSPRGGTYSAIYTHRTRTSTMFVKKSVTMYSVACQLLKKKVHIAFFRLQLYTQRNISVGFTDIQYGSLMATRNYLDI